MTKRRRRGNGEADIEQGILALLALGVFWVVGKTGSLVWGIGLLAVFVVITGAVVWKMGKARRARLAASGIDEVDKMDGKTFERFLLERFKRQGYTGHLTPASGDYGADLVVQWDCITMVIQAKRWKRTVGVEAVQQVAAAVKYYEAQQGLVITSSTFTGNARKLASSNGVLLWDREDLIDFLHPAVEGGKQK